METLLTPEILLTHGFIEAIDDRAGKTVYRLCDIKSKDYNSYGFDIQIELNPRYANSNPNCGIVSIYSPAFTSVVIPEDLISKEEWTEEDEKRADENLVPFEEYTQSIAWHVTTYERLRDIVKSLTLVDLEYNV